MKRAVITIAATVAGTAGVLAYNPAAQTAVDAATGTTGRPGGQTAAPQPGAASSGSSGSGSSGSGSSSGSSASGGVVTGDAFATRWGDVQVQVTFDGTKITGVSAVQLPNSDGHSMMLAQLAQQTLSQEVIQAQSANVDMVSGATFTSQAYLQSVQSALDSHKG